MIKRSITLTLGLPAAVRAAWTRPYVDARIILEQNADLRYLTISAKVQQMLVRSGIVLLGVVSGLILFLTVTSIALFVSRAKLERSHEQVYRALLSSAAEGEGGEPVELDEAQMVALAQTIRDRDMSIRRFVDTSMVAVAQENENMKDLLDTSGLTEKVIRVIQRNAANGGFAPGDDLNANPLLRGKVAEELSNNRAMREVLYALPNRMPVSNYSVSSDFGIRKHPITGLSNFHTGVDLLSETEDDNVHPVKPGIVVLAKYHSQYGNTVVVRHSNGIESLYGHLANMKVEVGDKVTTETILGRVGNTGVSTGKHLHLEILVGGYPVNPQKVIRTAQYVQQIQNQP
ncbi:MAG: M23 family metallopeptidase [Betaproteobacteria bacterium]|nr:M23 family metallopeptidase [Betaproteobacteria bacterium]